MEDHPTQLSDTEQVDWLRLVRTPSIGPRTFIELIERYGSPAAAITELPEIAQRARGKRRLFAPPEADIRAELSRLDAAGGRMIALSDPDYPAALAAIADPPPALLVKGDSTLLNNPTIAIVGASQRIDQRKAVCGGNSRRSRDRGLCDRVGARPRR